MYRESFDSMAAEIARLQDEVRRLNADADTTRRMTAPKQAIRLMGAAVVAAAVTANLCALGASTSRANELAACQADNRALARSLDESRAEVARERAALFKLQRDIEKERALGERVADITGGCTASRLGAACMQLAGEHRYGQQRMLEGER